MKKVLFLFLVLAVWQKWDVIFAPDYTDITADQVTLYATSWCGYCKKTREYFAENQIPYVEYDIEKSAKGKRQYDALKRSGVPVIKIGERVVVGYSIDQINSALSEL